MSSQIRLADVFFAPRQRRNLQATIPSALARCRETGRLDAFKLLWKPGSGAVPPHIYWDSDVAKVMEGMAYVAGDSPEIAAQLEELVDLVTSAQQPDGYLNTHFTVCDQDKRWHDLLNCHELYCAGHLTEAAVAHYEATGKRTFLDAMIRYADYICDTFGPDGVPGYPGHEELELALCKLYRATGNRRYLEQAKLFIDRRGTEPNYYVVREHADPSVLENRQAHRPVREQPEAAGHAVRAVYLYSGMADVAAATGDAELLAACERMFDSIAERKMYITGGIGSSQQGESFGHDLDLPPDRSYAESCAAIGLVFFASRMLRIQGKVKYADVVERAIFNGAMSGLSLSGDRFFYGNLLECHRGSLDRGHVGHERQPWFTTSCCPTSYCRFLPRLGDFCCRAGEDFAAVDVPVTAEVASGRWAFRVTSGYPYDGRITVEILRGGDFELSLRIPSWCRACTLPPDGVVKDGYWRRRGHWSAGEVVEYVLEMPPELVYSASPSNFGKAALCRGPLVYCVELPWNGPLSPFDLRFPRDPKFAVTPVPDLPEGTRGVRFTALAAAARPRLYSPEPPVFREVEVTAIPYALWQNRGKAQMAVFLPYER